MGEVQAAFDRDLKWARETLASSFLPPPGLAGWEGRKYVLTPWNYFAAWEQALEECDRRVLDGDFLSRLVSVTWAFRIWETLRDMEPLHEDDDNGPSDEEIAGARAKLADLVSLVRPSDVLDAREAEWELACRATLGLWEEAGQMLDRFILLAQPDERSGRILRGQFLTGVAFARNSERPIDYPTSWWRLNVDEGFGEWSAGDQPDLTAGAFLRPEVLMVYSLKLCQSANEDAAPSPCRRDWIEAAHHFQVADSIGPLPPHYLAAMALGHLWRGSQADALAAYRRFATARPWMKAEAVGKQVRRLTALAIAHLDAKSGIPLIEEYLAEKGESEGRQELYFLLAKLYIESDNQYPQALAVLNRAVEEFPRLGNDPATGVGLALGRIGVDAMNPVAIRKRAPLPTEVERLASGLLNHLVIGFDRLHKQTREDLVAAAASLYSGVWPRENVMTVFWAARALENELHYRVVQPLGMTTRDNAAPTLGQVFFAILEPKGDADRKVRHEAVRRYPKIQSWAALEAKPLVRWRNAVNHPSSDVEPRREDAVEFFRSATRFLSLFAGGSG